MQHQRVISVIGTGNVGSTLVSLLADADHRLIIGSRHGANHLNAELAALVHADQVELRAVPDCGQGADIVVLAVPWKAALTTVAELSLPAGQIVVDTTNFNLERDGADTDPGSAGTTTALQDAFPSLRWVKSFNMLWTGYLRRHTDRTNPTTVVFIAGDDPDAKANVSDLIVAAGFVPFDNGTLADAVDRQLQGTPAWNRPLRPSEAAEMFPEAPGDMT